MLLLQKPGSSSTTTRVLKGFFGQAVAACILYKRARKQGHKKAIPCRSKQGHLSSIVLEPYFPLDIEPLDYHQYYQMPPTLIVKALCLKVESHKAVGFEKYKVHYCLATIRQMQLTTNSASFSAFLHALLVLCFVYRRPRIRNMPALYNTRKLFVEKWLSPQTLCYG